MIPTIVYTPFLLYVSLRLRPEMKRQLATLSGGWAAESTTTEGGHPLASLLGVPGRILAGAFRTPQTAASCTRWRPQAAQRSRGCTRPRGNTSRPGLLRRRLIEHSAPHRYQQAHFALGRLTAPVAHHQGHCRPAHVSAARHHARPPGAPACRRSLGHAGRAVPACTTQHHTARAIAPQAGMPSPLNAWQPTAQPHQEAEQQDQTPASHSQPAHHGTQQAHNTKCRSGRRRLAQHHTVCNHHM